MDFLQAVVNGLMIGGVYALISVGLTLVFGVMEIVNFAQAEFLMLGMYGAYFSWRHFHTDPLASAIFVFVTLFIFGAIIERFLMEPLIRSSQLSQVFATVGLGIVLKNAAAVVFGNEFLSVQTVYQTQFLNVGGLKISMPYLLAFCFAVVAALCLNLFLKKSEFGQVMRATSQNRVSAVLLGINPRRVYMVAFGLGIGLTGLAGAVILPYTTVFPTVGNQYVLIMFTIVVLGGLSSVRGAMIAGLFIGIVQSVSAIYLPIELQNLVVFIIFFAALVLIRGEVIKRVRFGTRFLYRKG